MLVRTVLCRLPGGYWRFGTVKSPTGSYGGSRGSKLAISATPAPSARVCRSFGFQLVRESASTLAARAKRS